MSNMGEAQNKKKHFAQTNTHKKSEGRAREGKNWMKKMIRWSFLYYTLR